MDQKFIPLKIIVLIVILFAFNNLNKAYAQNFDIEADPMAYLFKGLSVHAGYSFDMWRFSLGTFGIDLPQAFHGNEGFDSYMKGAGISSDFFFSKYTEGLFIGANTGFMHFKIKNTDD